MKQSPDNERASSCKPRSLASRLFRMVFGVYLLVAVGVTVFQMRSEYLNTKQSITQDVTSLAVSFSPALAAALWTFNDTLLDALLVGLDNIPFVTGYEIRNRHGELERAGGILLDKEGLPVAAPFSGGGKKDRSGDDATLPHCEPMTRQ